MAVSSGFLITFLLIAIPTAYAAQHIVGGSSGWTNFGVDYDTWAAGETFTVGDTLSFNYGLTHGVAEVSENDYSSCSSSNAINTYNDGSTAITLSKAGSMYFICPTGGHCGSGMKLKVNVVDASTPTTPSPTTPTAPSPTTPSTPSPSPTTPTTPSPTTPTTPSPTTPSPSSGSSTPADGTPTTTSSPSAPAGSNSGAIIFSNMKVGSLIVLGTALALMG